MKPTIRVRLSARCTVVHAKWAYSYDSRPTDHSRRIIGEALAIHRAESGNIETASRTRDLGFGSRRLRLTHHGIGGMTMSCHVLCSGAFCARSVWV